ncbi:hypothetical protein DICPUDRAFT_158792 [Dictyostelium purpureum]|uniref:HTTM-like domain-containing protein n=1 Tax=Dictyostelium purpureum TaxID=5786 RepID=F1A2H8_DICPU|nr:uncharacterized protein DICPUDRAFT_158792 [Dictyostelium purpureum]EGC29606.1 hypothetical protein DICPUDRAFT_158792 [Dictyostelium purpureum]|eukprot:XP_003293874.1 hypothetical protein DICPUDRAFT_158792 [Dictyostelium purpureum]
MGLGIVNKKQPTTSVSKFQTLFGVDKRSLALFRVCVGIVGLYDLIERWVDIKAHYSDEGIVPRSMVTDNFWNKSWYSFHLMTGSVEGIQFLFLINILICFLLLVGYRSRLMMFLHYTFVLSLQARNNIVGHGGDVYMRVISFFGMLLPIGSVFSIDSAFKKPVLRRENKKFAIVNFATFAIILQIIFLYSFSYVHKTGDEWRVDYTASYYALQLDYFRTFLVDYIIEFPSLLTAMTFGVLYYEGFGFVLLFIPFFTAQIRSLGALGFTMLHIGFGAFMRLGIFSPICASGTLLLYPTWLWDNIFNRLRTRERTDFKIYYSGKYGYYITGLVSTFLLFPEVEISPTPTFIDEESFIQTNNGLNNIINNNNNAADSYDHMDQPKIQHDSIPLCVQSSSHLNNWIITRDYRGNKFTGYNALVSIVRASPLLFLFTRLFENRFVSSYGKKVVSFTEKAIVKINDDILVLKPDNPLFYNNNINNDITINNENIYTNSNITLIKNISQTINSDSDGECSLINSPPNGAANSNYTLLKSEMINEEIVNHQQYQRKLNRRRKIVKLSRNAFFNIFAIMGIIFALGWNCANTTCPIPSLPPSIHWLVFLTRVDQMWSMFSPRPPNQHWWYTFEGTLDNGDRVELWNNDGLFTWEPNYEPYTRDKPNPYPSCIGNHRWFKVYENLNNGAGYELIRLGLGKWICREYNARHFDNRLWKFNIIYRNELQHLNNTRSLLPDQNLWSHICYNKPQASKDDDL